MGVVVRERGTLLSVLIKRAKALTSGKVVRAAAVACGREAKAIVTETFDNERSTAGVAWRRLARPTGRKILVKTGRLRRVATRPVVAGYSVFVFWPIHGALHMEGTRYMPARPFAPTSPLDPRTRARFEHTIATVLRTIR